MLMVKSSKKGDIFWRDCAVTGSNEGSPDNPKFTLLLWFLMIFSQLLRNLLEKVANMKATG